MEILGYFLMFVMGISLGLLGGGGSILTVPILIYVFDIKAVDATASSLFVVGIASAVGALRKIRDGLVNFKVGAAFAIPGFVGVFLARAFIVPNLPRTILSTGAFTLTKDALIMIVFSVMMIAASISMIRTPKSNSVASSLTPKPMAASALIALEGLLVGALTGFVGAGGGFLIIPALVVLTKLPMKIAVGTSLVIIAFKSLLGFLGDVLTHPEIDWIFLSALSAVSTVGILVGSLLSKKIPDQGLKKGFGYFVLIMGGFILFQQL